MLGRVPDVSGVRRRRPKDRKKQIIRAAGELFHSGSYHLVSMGDIAAAVGITESAMYRHFSSKQELLYRAIADGIEAFGDIIDTSQDEDIIVVVDRLAALILDERQVGLLWQRESRHLAPDQRRALRNRLRAIATGFADTLRGRRPELSSQDATVLTWSALSVLTSPSYHHVDLERSYYETLLSSAVLAVLDVTPVGRSTSVGSERNVSSAGRPYPLSRVRSSRREQLLRAAVRRFAEHGYVGVTMRQVGADIGISGPSIYNHFSNKADLLWAALNRGGEALHLRMSQILQTNSTAADVLRALIRDYAQFTYDQHEIVRILLSEAAHVPEPQRSAVQQSQHDYVVEWVGLLREARPGLDQSSARCLVQAALTIANDLSRTPSLRTRPGLVTEIATCGEAVLFARLGRSEPGGRSLEPTGR